MSTIPREIFVPTNTAADTIITVQNGEIKTHRWHAGDSRANCGSPTNMESVPDHPLIQYDRWQAGGGRSRSCHELIPHDRWQATEAKSKSCHQLIPLDRWQPGDAKSRPCHSAILERPESDDHELGVPSALCLGCYRMIQKRERLPEIPKRVLAKDEISSFPNYIVRQAAAA